MVGRIVGIHQDIIQVYHNVNIQQICEEGVKGALESSWCVGQTFQNDPEIIRAITGTESGFVLVTSGDAEQVIGVAKVQFGVNTRLSRSVEEICNQRKQIAILLHDVIQSSVVDAKPETSVFCLAKRIGALWEE
jgi:hypothetical protein